MKRWMLISMMAVLTAAAIPAASRATVSISQQSYFFTMEVTRNVTAGTFVIGDFGLAPVLKPPAAPTFAVNDTARVSPKTAQSSTSSPLTAPFVGLIRPILFDLGSATLPAKAETIVLPQLADKVTMATPLQVTGYTCDLGSQAINDALALRRAEAVADMLRPHGYIVPVITGRGKCDYVSTDAAQRHLNRRVEINIASRPTWSPQ